LEALAVSAGHRNRGIGRRLLEASLEHAAGKELAQVRLHVVEPNLRAKAFYERVGFETTRYRRVPLLWRWAFRFGGYYELIKQL
jgi:ribosomal protein S18 acetylase RimI-like enzyme